MRALANALAACFLVPSFMTKPGERDAPSGKSRSPGGPSATRAVRRAPMSHPAVD
jgi:hypothetical protein